MFAPDFFICGAQKCGTTMLYHYLKSHPGVFLPDLKEPHFFCSDLPGLNAVGGDADYQQLYQEASDSCVLGDASASYFFSAFAIVRVLERNPSARFILMLRSPVEMIQAYHSELCYNLSEDVVDFEQAWRLQPERKIGKRIPSSCNEPKKLQYSSVASLGDQLERFFDIVPEKQRLVILHDDVKNDLDGVYRLVLEFLDLDLIVPERFEKINERKRVRSRTLAHFHKNLPRLLGPFYRPLRGLVNGLGFSPSRFLEKFNTEKVSSSRLDPDFLLELNQFLEPQVSKLELLLAQDLSHWNR